MYIIGKPIKSILCFLALILFAICCAEETPNSSRHDQGAGDSDGDFNDDGFVNRADLLILQDNFGAGGASDTIPEPATLGLLAFGAIAVIRRRRKA